MPEKKRNLLSFRILLVGAAFLYAVMQSHYRTGILNDDVIYILGARSILHSGPIDSYCMRPDYPSPGMPLLLAPFVKWVEPNWVQLEWVLTALTVALLFLTEHWTRPLLTARRRFALVLLLAVNPIILKFSGLVMPSIPYACAAIGSFWLLDQLITKSEQWKALLLGFLVGWASLLRPEGAVLAISVLLVLSYMKNTRKVLPAFLAPLAFWGWVVYAWWHRFPPEQTGYGGDVQALARFWMTNFSTGLEFVPKLFRSVLVSGVTGIRLPMTTAGYAAATVIGTVLLAGMVHGFTLFWKTREKHRPMLAAVALYSSFYFVSHIFWHVATRRYAIPLLPFMGLFLVQSVSTLFHRLPKGRAWGTGAVVLFLSFYVIRYVSRDMVENPGYEPPWKSLEWLKTQTPQEARVLSSIGPSVELYADRAALPGVRAAHEEMFLYQLHSFKVGYVLDRQAKFLAQGVEGTDDPNQDWRHFRYRFMTYPNHFETVYQNPEELSVIYRVKAEPEFVRAYDQVRVAYRWYQAGRLDEARTVARMSLALYPQLACATHLLAAIAWRENKLEEAEQLFLQTIKIMPTAAKPMINLATLYHQVGFEVQSRAMLEKVEDVSEAKGEGASHQGIIDKLHEEWSRHQATVYLDIP